MYSGQVDFDIKARLLSVRNIEIHLSQSRPH